MFLKIKSKTNRDHFVSLALDNKTPVDQCLFRPTIAEVIFTLPKLLIFPNKNSRSRREEEENTKGVLQVGDGYWEVSASRVCFCYSQLRYFSPATSELLKNFDSIASRASPITLCQVLISEEQWHYKMFLVIPCRTGQAFLFSLTVFYLINSFRCISWNALFLMSLAYITIFVTFWTTALGMRYEPFPMYEPETGPGTLERAHDLQVLQDCLPSLLI